MYAIRSYYVLARVDHPNFGVPIRFPGTHPLLRDADGFTRVGDLHETIRGSQRHATFQEVHEFIDTIGLFFVFFPFSSRLVHTGKEFLVARTECGHG